LATFQYKAYTARGAVTAGTIVADGLDAAVDALYGLGLTPFETRGVADQTTERASPPSTAQRPVETSIWKRELVQSNRFSLKESGSIENDAHLVILTHCPTNKAGQRTFEDELIIAKQRHGPVGSEQVYFKPESLRFYSRSRYERQTA